MSTIQRYSDLWDLRRARLRSVTSSFARRDLRELGNHIIHTSDVVLAENEWRTFDLVRSSPVAVLFNQGALLQYSAGNLARAEDLCRKAIDLFVSMAVESGDRRWLAFAIQPYVNSGRLQGLSGSARDSVKCYESLLNFVQGRDTVVLGGESLGDVDREIVLDTDPQVESVVRNVYVIDSAKAYLASREYDEALEFLGGISDKLQVRSRYIEYVGLEAVARAYCGLGRYGEALKALDQFHRGITEERRPFVGIYSLLADVYDEVGMREHALKILRTADGYVSQIEEKGAEPALLMEAWLGQSLSYLSLNQPSDAFRAGTRALSWAATVGDEVATIESMIVVLRSSTKGCADVTDHRANVYYWFAELLNKAYSTLYRFQRGLAFWELAASGEAIERESSWRRGSTRRFGLESANAFHGIHSPDSASCHTAVLEFLREASDGPPENIAESNGAEIYRCGEIEQSFDLLMGLDGTHVPIATDSCRD